jgi:hypothetical protein
MQVVRNLGYAGKLHPDILGLERAAILQKEVELLGCTVDRGLTVPDRKRAELAGL